eukprot:scaffold1068_cov375-Prasinococcus_capsulatus_cf.AAC.12
MYPAGRPVGGLGSGWGWGWGWGCGAGAGSGSGTGCDGAAGGSGLQSKFSGQSQKLYVVLKTRPGGQSYSRSVRLANAKRVPFCGCRCWWVGGRSWGWDLGLWILRRRRLGGWSASIKLTDPDVCAVPEGLRVAGVASARGHGDAASGVLRVAFVWDTAVGCSVLPLDHAVFAGDPLRQQETHGVGALLRPEIRARWVGRVGAVRIDQWMAIQALLSDVRVRDKLR